MTELDRQLHDAVTAGDLARVRELLAAGADPDAIDDRTDVYWTGPRPLHAAIGAVEDGAPLALVQLLLDHGATVNAWDRDHSAPPLLDAVSCGQVDTVRLLLAHGADPDVCGDEGDTPIRVAVLDLDDPAMAELLLTHGVAGTIDTPGGSEASTPLGAAAWHGRLDMVERLLAAGADPDAIDYDHYTASDRVDLELTWSRERLDRLGRIRDRLDAALADRASQPPVARRPVPPLPPPPSPDVRDRDDTSRALCDAALRGDLARARELLAAGANPDAIGTNKPGWRPLQFAIYNDQDPDAPAAMIELLLDHGADINAWDSLRHSTPLSLAVAFRNLGIARLLLARGADPNIAVLDGRTPIRWAAIEGDDADMTDLLLAHDLGASVDYPAAGDDGLTPLGAAARMARLATVDRLLAGGADPAATDRNGDTALDLTRRALVEVPAFIDRLERIRDILRDASARRRAPEQ